MKACFEVNLGAIRCQISKPKTERKLKRKSDKNNVDFKQNLKNPLHNSESRL